MHVKIALYRLLFKKKREHLKYYSFSIVYKDRKASQLICIIKQNNVMKRYQKTIIREVEAFIPFLVTVGIVALLTLSVYLLQDFTKIYHIYTTF